MEAIIAQPAQVENTTAWFAKMEENVTQVAQIEDTIAWPTETEYESDDIVAQVVKKQIRACSSSQTRVESLQTYIWQR